MLFEMQFRAAAFLWWLFFLASTEVYERFMAFCSGVVGWVVQQMGTVVVEVITAIFKAFTGSI